MQTTIFIPRQLVLARLGRAEVALAAQSVLGLALMLVCVAAWFHPARADVVSREAVTLGRLANDSDVIALTRVTAVSPTQVTLQVEVALKRAKATRLTLPPGRQRWTVGARQLCFLRFAPNQGPGGRTLARPASEFHVITADDPQAADELVRVVRGRLPRIGGDPNLLRRELFAQLGSSLARVRQDAALELLEHRLLRPSATERVTLRSALSHHPEEALLRLAARVPEPGLLSPVLQATRQAANRELAATALEAIDPAAAAARLGTDLRGSDVDRAVAAAQTLGHLAGAEPLAQLSSGLARPEARVRGATIQALAIRSDLAAGHLAALEELVWRARGGRDAELALAALALTGPGAALLRVERSHADPALRRLAADLRREPIAGAGRILRQDGL